MIYILINGTSYHSSTFRVNTVPGIIVQLYKSKMKIYALEFNITIVYIPYDSALVVMFAHLTLC